MDISTWLSSTGLAGTEDHFVQAPAYPYYVFNDKVTVTGADMKNLITRHSIGLELYAPVRNADAESRIERLLDASAIPYEKERFWISSEKHLETLYTFVVIETT